FLASITVPSLFLCSSPSHNPLCQAIHTKPSSLNSSADPPTRYNNRSIPALGSFTIRYRSNNLGQFDSSIPIFETNNVRVQYRQRVYRTLRK
ncbi:MAG: hypothetical protein J3Q66DRAFT_440890, partial [Benniella sp.]